MKKLELYQASTAADPQERYEQLSLDQLLQLITQRAVMGGDGKWVS